MSEPSKLPRRQLEDVLSTVPDIVALVDPDLQVQYLNRPDGEDDLDRSAAIDFVAPSKRDSFQDLLARVFESGKVATFRFPFTEVAEGSQWFQGTLTPIEQEGNVVRVVVTAESVADRRAAEKEAEHAGELIPVCSWCGRLRTRDELWVDVERYIEKLTDSLLTHGMCPECGEHTVRSKEEGTALGRGAGGDTDFAI